MDLRREQVVIEIERYRIQGALHLPAEGYRSRLSDYMNQREAEFLPMTDCKITTLDSAHAHERDVEFLLVARAHVRLIAPVDVAGDQISDPLPEGAMGLTVAITGPTGDIGRALLRRLDHAPEVEKVLGMARRPFDPAELGLTKTEYRQGDILDEDSVSALVDGADVLVHLAFIILGGHDETRRINLEGTRNVFGAAVSSGVKRFVYTSSVAAYGFHEENPQPLTEEVLPKGTDEFYYSAQKAELERELHRLVDGNDVETYVFRPCVVAGEDALTLVETMIKQLQLGGRLPQVTSFLNSVPFLKPVLPDPGSPFQLVHHDDVAQALVASITGRGEPGIYNLAGEGTIGVSDLAGAVGWYSVPVPGFAVDLTAEVIAKVPFAPAEFSWIEALRVPVLMDTAKARDKLGWEPAYDTHATLAQTVEGAREEGLI